MDAKRILVSALTLGLAAGYAWSAMPSATAGTAMQSAAPGPALASRVSQAAPTPEEIEHSVYYPNCAAARSAGHTPIFRGQPGYREEMDGDLDRIACEPYRGMD